MATLAEITAARAQLAAERKARDEAKALAEAERQLALDLTQADYEKQHPTAEIVRTRYAVFAIKKCSGDEYQRFVDVGETTYGAILAFVEPSVVAPDPASFRKLIDEYPALLPQVSNSIMRLAGLDRDALQGKS